MENKNICRRVLRLKGSSYGLGRILIKSDLQPVRRLGCCTGEGWSMCAKGEAHGAAGLLYRQRLEACFVCCRVCGDGIRLLVESCLRCPLLSGFRGWDAEEKRGGQAAESLKKFLQKYMEKQKPGGL